MSLEKFFDKKEKEKINPSEKYPVIWKIEKCLMGECRGMRTTHRWAIPAGTPNGMMTECYDCHNTRFVHTESNDELWINKPKTSGFVFERLLKI